MNSGIQWRRYVMFTGNYNASWRVVFFVRMRDGRFVGNRRVVFAERRRPPEVTLTVFAWRFLLKVALDMFKWDAIVWEGPVTSCETAVCRTPGAWTFPIIFVTYWLRLTCCCEIFGTWLVIEIVLMPMFSAVGMLIACGSTPPRCFLHVLLRLAILLHVWIFEIHAWVSKI